MGWYNITIYQKNINVLITPLTYLLNLCLSSGIFPNVLKDSIVVPVFKSGERDSITNYRPISLLPTLAKILEKIINHKLVNYLEKNNILAVNQYGFRKNKSTVNAIEDLVTNIAENLDHKRKCIGVFLDLVKDFDTVSIPLLIRKLV